MKQLKIMKSACGKFEEPLHGDLSEQILRLKNLKLLVFRKLLDKIIENTEK